MKVWAELTQRGSDHVYSKDIRVFQTIDNLLGCWKEELRLGDNDMEQLRAGVPRIESSGDMLDELVVYKVDLKTGQMARHCARPVEIDGWYSQNSRKGI